MQSEIIKCKKCKTFLGILTNKGFLIGNMIIKELKGKCQCGERFELVKNEIVTAQYSEICK